MDTCSIFWLAPCIPAIRAGFYGPVYSSFNQFRSSGLVFELSQAIGFIGASMMLSHKHWWQAINIGVAGCLIISLSMFFVSGLVNPVMMSLLGLLSATSVVGWSIPYTYAITKNRIRFMASAILIANIILFFFGLIVWLLPFKIAFILSQIPLIGAFILLRGMQPHWYEEALYHMLYWPFQRTTS